MSHADGETRHFEVADLNAGHLGPPQAGLPTQNISQVVTPSTTGRFTASLEAQLQQTQIDASTLECTLRICVGPTICGAAKSIGTSWSTFLLTIQLRAHEARTISFVTSCSTPAYVAIRSIVFPGQGTSTAIQTVTSILPASTTTETVTETMTTTTEFASSTCAVESSTEISTTSSETSESPSESTSESLSESASEPAPDPPPDPPPAPAPREHWNVVVVNKCRLRGQWAVIATQPQVSGDRLLFTSSYVGGLSIVSDDANPTFLAVSGGQMCIISQHTGQQWCGYGTVEVHVTSNHDNLNVDCPTLASSPDMSATIPLSIEVNIFDDEKECDYFAYQIGCEPGNFCLGQGYENKLHENNRLELRWPVAGAYRLRVRQIGTARTKWRVIIGDSTYGYGNLVFHQSQGDRLVIPDLHDTAGYISLYASCYGI
jgi:hypothetical protein